MGKESWKMKVVIIYGSVQIGARIQYDLTGLRNVEIIGNSTRMEESVSCISSQQPRVVILDSRLPYRTSIEILKKAKALTSPPIVIATTDVPYEQYLRECQKEGADYFYYLPEEIDQLSETVFSLAQQQTIQ
jgi:DNA-binding NarL/FixJ family response regulator